MGRANLAELPADIILQILEYVAEPAKIHGNSWTFLIHDIPTDNALRTIQNVRLTCRALSQIATPILFPVLCVSINYKSVNAFEQLSKNPIIAAKARGVVVNLAMFSRDIAADLVTFKKERLEEIHRRMGSLEWRMNARLHEGDEEDEDVKEYHRIRATLRLLSNSWEQVASTHHGGQMAQAEPKWDDKALQSKFADILLASHNEYVRCHRAQLEWLNDKQAMSQLVTGFSRLACGGKIQFSSQTRRALCRDAWDLEIKELLDDPQTLSHAMIQPYYWQKFYKEDEENDWSMVKVLSSLPIALAEAGVLLTELFVGDFPHYTGFTELLAHESQTVEDLEEELRMAFRHLQVFRFGDGGMNSQNMRRKPLSESNLSYMRAYLRAAVASPLLQELDMTFYTYVINTGRGDEDELAFELGPVLQSLTSSRLTRIVLSDFAAKSNELTPLLSRLGPKMKFYHLASATLLDGCWAPLLDLLHESIAQRCRDGLCWGSVVELCGAEFGHQKREALDLFTFDSDEWSKASKDPKLVRRAHDYIRGKRATNPLRSACETLEASGGSDSDDS